jgi:putative membrane protein
MADQPPFTSNQLAEQRTDLARHRTEAAGERTDLAVERTVLAHERTLMAWIRTATSLISFGFTVYKFFDALQEAKTGASTRLLGPRGFAIVMISIGLVALVLATVEHSRSLAQLRAAGAPAKRSLSLVIAAMVALLGVGGLVLAILGR